MLIDEIIMSRTLCLREYAWWVYLQIAVYHQSSLAVEALLNKSRHKEVIGLGGHHHGRRHISEVVHLRVEKVLRVESESGVADLAVGLVFHENFLIFVFVLGFCLALWGALTFFGEPLVFLVGEVGGEFLEIFLILVDDGVDGFEIDLEINSP